jgi:hypothetical protein
MLSEKEFSLLSTEKKSEYLRRLRASRGRSDLFYLANEVLGYPDFKREVHGRMVKLLESPLKKKLFLLPRGSLKTTGISVSYATQRILNNPNIRILLDSEILELTQKVLAQVKRGMQQPGFAEVYGQLIDSRARETAREFTVSSRTNPGLKEATITAAGIGTVQVGSHYDLIIADDLHSEKNIATRDQIEKVIAHYRLLLSLLEPGGELIIVGTRWHFMDLYSYILEQEANRPGSEWQVLIEKAIRDDGSLFFPERLTREFLEQQRVSQGDYLFSVLYQNDPVSSASAIFKKEDFKYSEGDDFPLQDGKRILLNIYLLFDRAFSTKESADYTGCIAVGVAASGNIYVLEAERHKFGLQEMFDLIAKWIFKYGADRIRKVGIETINWEELYNENGSGFIQQAMRKRNLFFIVERLLPDQGVSKERRIAAALEARYRNHAVYHKKGMWDLEDELMRFPKCTHDDLVDALAYVVPFMTVPGAAGYEKEPEDFIPAGWFGKVGY